MTTSSTDRDAYVKKTFDDPIALVSSNLERVRRELKDYRQALIAEGKESNLVRYEYYKSHHERLTMDVANLHRRKMEYLTAPIRKVALS